MSLSVNTVIINDVEMVPLSSISTLLGIKTPINPKSKQINLKYDDLNLQFEPGSSYISINGEKIDMGIEPGIIDNIVYIPIEIIDMAFDGLTSWNQEKKEIAVPINPKASDSNANTKTTGSKPGKISLDVSKSGFMGNLVLVNKSNPVSSKYVPSNLSSVLDKNKKYLIPSKNSSVKLDKEALDAAITMFKAANSQGIKNLIVSNGYRSYSLQSSTFNRKISAYKKIYRGKEAEERASTIVAPPGKSEHQTGLALDVTSRKLLNTKYALSESFASTAEGKWIYQNSWKYGYIVRYQADKTKITGIISEPWHIRYVGIPHAEYMYKNKLCLEEYLDHIKKVGYIRYRTNSGTEYEVFYISVPTSVETLTLTYSGSDKYQVSSYGKNGFIVTKKV